MSKKKTPMTGSTAGLIIAEYAAELTKGDPRKYAPYREVALRISRWNSIGNFNKGKWRDWLCTEHPELYLMVWPKGQRDVKRARAKQVARVAKYWRGRAR